MSDIVREHTSQPAEHSSAWGECETTLLGGGQPNPLLDETLGPLLEELIETHDDELAAYITELLQELLAE